MANNTKGLIFVSWKTTNRLIELLDPSEIMKINDLFRTCNMYENIEPLSDEIKVFQCEEADETSSINSALSAMSLRSMANSRCNENIPVNEDIFQKVKRVQQMAALRRENKDNEKDPLPVKTRLARHDDDEEDEEYDEEKGQMDIFESIRFHFAFFQVHNY